MTRLSMIRPGPLLGQFITYALFAVLLGVFANGPAWAPVPPDKAQILLTLIHAGKPAGECRERSAEEMAKLAPNMRRLKVCPRQRVSLLVEMEIDGKPVYREWLKPAGLSGDFPSHAYRRFAVDPGPHRITIRLRDSARAEGFDHEAAAETILVSRQNFAIDFRAAVGGFTFN